MLVAMSMRLAAILSLLRLGLAARQRITALNNVGSNLRGSVAGQIGG